jgi:hypothetical protein
MMILSAFATASSALVITSHPLPNLPVFAQQGRVYHPRCAAEPQPFLPEPELQPFFALVWYSPAPFVYETLYGGAAQAPLGRSAVRVSTLVQAHALGRKLSQSAPSVTYNVYKLAGSEMELKGSYPKGVNAAGARIKFRRRRPPLGGADDSLLGVGGMGDDIWREVQLALELVSRPGCLMLIRLSRAHQLLAPFACAIE